MVTGVVIGSVDACCAATGPREQESTLYDIATHFGVVTDSPAVVAALRSGTAIENENIAA